MNPASLAAWMSAMPVNKAETIKLEFALAIDSAIKSLGLTRKEVAAIMQTTPAWVTKVLRGDVNLTIESMAKLCNAVGLELQINVVARRGAAAPLLTPSATFPAEPPHVLEQVPSDVGATPAVRRKKRAIAIRDPIKRRRA